MKGRRAGRVVRRKYRNIPTGGFDSRKEAAVYAVYELMRKAGRILAIERQVRFELIPPIYDGQGKLLERACYYVADFVITYPDGTREVVDVKSPVTRTLPAYVIKRKLLLWRNGLRISER